MRGSRQSGPVVVGGEGTTFGGGSGRERWGRGGEGQDRTSRPGEGNG